MGGAGDDMDGDELVQIQNADDQDPKVLKDDPLLHREHQECFRGVLPKL